MSTPPTPASSPVARPSSIPSETPARAARPGTPPAGDIAKKPLAPGFDPEHAAFLMPGASGPCRFGQYNRLHRLVLDELGLPQGPILVLDQIGRASCRERGESS